VLTEVQRRIRHPVVRYMAATLDGMVEATGAVFEAKFMLPWSFTEEGAAEKYMPQLQHNMWVTNAKLSVLSIITGGGKWVEISIPAALCAWRSMRRSSLAKVEAQKISDRTKAGMARAKAKGIKFKCPARSKCKRRLS